MTNVPLSKFVVIWHNTIRFSPVFWQPVCSVFPSYIHTVGARKGRPSSRDVRSRRCSRCLWHYRYLFIFVTNKLRVLQRDAIFVFGAATSRPLITHTQQFARALALIQIKHVNAWIPCEQFWILIAHIDPGTDRQRSNDKAAKIPRCDLFPLPCCNRFTGNKCSMTPIGCLTRTHSNQHGC